MGLWEGKTWSIYILLVLRAKLFSHLISQGVSEIVKKANPINSHHKQRNIYIYIYFFFFFYFLNVASVWSGDYSLNLLWSSVHDVCESNHYAAHLKLIQCCMLITSQWNREKKKEPSEVVTLQPSIFFFSWFISCGPFLKSIKFVTILLLLYILVFWPQGMWDLSPPPRIAPPSPALEGEVFTTGPPGKSPA